MKLKVPKTKRRKNSSSKGLQIVRRVLIIAVVVVLLALSGTHLFALITGNTDLNKPSEIVSTAVTPIQGGFSTVVDWIANYLYKLKYNSTLELEYNKVVQRNEQLEYDAMRVDELEKKLSVYENLFDEVSDNEKLDPLVAEVIGRESGNYFSVFTINKGSNHGISEYMAVTMDAALIGFTYNVSPTQCSVRSIIDSEASIGGLIQSTRDQGTVRGTLGIDGKAMCRMYYLPEDLLPRPGDTVVTSGVVMPFPKGIPIGTVRESTRGMESNKQYIVVEPKADFEHVEYVIVLRYQPTAEAVESRVGTDDLTITAVETARPIPTVQIGNDFYQLTATATPSPLPSDVTPSPEIGEGETPAPMPSPTGNSNSVEYQVPSNTQTSDYGFTLPPTASPSPTPSPLDLSVEEDD